MHLSSKAIAVWVALCAFSDEDGFCYPSRKTIESFTSMGESSVKRALEELQDKKWIRVKSRKKKDGSYSSNYYTLYVLD